MRYIGNKTRLIPFLMETLDRLGIRPGVACDPFAGTASVARALKARGWKVHSGDLMALSYALQVSRVELDRTPAYRRDLLGPAPGTRRRARTTYAAVLAHLETIDPSAGFFRDNFGPNGGGDGGGGRMYFTAENAARIDAVRERIARWAAEGLVDRQQEQLLLATLIQAADRVANTTGVYASFVKSWQPNARRPLRLRPIRPTVPRSSGAGECTAFRGPADELVQRRGAVDLLYLDPPYNERQYPGYYHVPELIAVGWFPPPSLRGKTGLIPDGDRRSEWCSRRTCEAALRRLLKHADARHILLSYNDEGLLSPAVIEAVLRESGDPDTYRRFGHGYRRYRSDSDGPRRSYRGDSVREWLHYVRRR